MSRQRKRRRAVIPRGPQSMYVIAGLPKTTFQQSIDMLTNRFPSSIIQGVPSSQSDNKLYSKQTVDAVLRATSEFAIRRRSTDSKQTLAPATITLLYVPAPDDERLLSAFDFSVMSAPLSVLASRNEQARQRRHFLGDVEQALVDALKPSGFVREALNHVVRRLGYQSDNEALLLPPRNFFVEDHDLVPVFQAYRRGERSWTDRMPEYGPTELTCNNIPRIDKGKTRHAFVDHRNMSFLIAHPTAYHALPRQLDDEATPSIKSKLCELYRFGGALPSGLHHDAQRDDGSPLGGASFNCDQDGLVSAEGTHANVYPNDFVRADTKNSRA